jgi:hypothetical protein
MFDGNERLLGERRQPAMGPVSGREPNPNGGVMKSSLMIAASFVALTVGHAIAGIADSPLPVLLPGSTTVHLYSVVGAMGGGGLGTYFSCTSTDTVPIQVGVELFDSTGGSSSNDVVTSSRSVDPGGTVVFGTVSAVGIPVDSTLGILGRGSARILATSKKLVCNAFVADRLNTPPTVGWQLTIIAKTKQKASN